MRKIRLTLACGDYEIMRGLKDGSVEPDGIDLHVLTGDRTRTFKSHRRDECDLAEFNVVGYLADREKDPSITALPVFPHRRFRHGFIFCRTGSDIRVPADLRGRKVGIMGERPAAVVWLRGILSDCYGVGYRSVQWIDAYGLLGQRAQQVPGEPGGERGLIENMLLRGDLAAVLAPSFPPAFIRGDQRIRRLFSDFKSEEIDYYAKTKIFPIMHTVVIKRSIVDEYPWVPSSLARAFEEAKELAYQAIRNPRTLPLAFLTSSFEEQTALLGSDPWQYGLGPENEHNLRTIIRYSHEQGLIERPPEVREAFLPLDESAFFGTPGF
jgi:4,5-dihydroxyphthalate decarboxylase